MPNRHEPSQDGKTGDSPAQVKGLPETPKAKVECGWCKKFEGSGICLDCLLRHFPTHYQLVYGDIPVDDLLMTSPERMLKYLGAKD